MEGTVPILERKDKQQKGSYYRPYRVEANYSNGCKDVARRCLSYKRDFRTNSLTSDRDITPITPKYNKIRNSVSLYHNIQHVIMNEQGNPMKQRG
ncbi:hypothetical protein PCURB6_43170 [Paenibacillus curdlanolyticus]|nr:hypothetical protein PCURB6_43170 [Paenibacillus curdlanolyticus]